MMNKIVGIGACVMDTLITLPEYPDEDTKMRASATKVAGGGPTATGIVAARKLGIPAGFVGVLSDDNGGKFLAEDFEKYGVDTKNITFESGYRSFTSVIWLSAKSASRTCVFDKGDLPPLSLNESQKKAVADAEILMIDGNEIDGAEEACLVAKENGTNVLYDCGGLYEGVERLLKLTDIMIPSEEFALKKTNSQNAEEAAEKLMNMYHPAALVITQGKEGGLYYDGKKFWHYPAFKVNAIDTNGSGDVFHGAFAAGRVYGFDFEKCCIFASAVSAIKCTGIGARESVPTLETVKKFLKEKGYEL
ncbi:MAG: hypothetical protein E7633_05475 [Ruminococcaceae bacterium]|nr:hypothetical protein [Oscillospiraceae bacterium]